MTDHLTILGNKVNGALTKEGLEFFPAPSNVDKVKFVSHEVVANCPVTDQPDLYTIEITYYPNEKCVESKSLKLYLQQWRNDGIFGEGIADKIAKDLFEVLQPHHVEVKAVQQIRGGLQMTVTASKDDGQNPFF